MADQVDVFLCSRSRYGQVARLDLGKPVIELRFHVSRQSAARVVEALAKPRIAGAHLPPADDQFADAAGQTSPA